MTYPNLTRGSTGDEVKKLQSAIGINADGVYGSQTEAAVRKYQQQNGLSVDGIAGNSTLTSLYGNAPQTQTQTAPAATQKTTPTMPTAPTMPDMPQYTSQYDAQMQSIFDKLMNREKFSYDPLSDPVYQQYRDSYTQQGQMAMQDTMGQAAALTGGYGSSYAQSVGQQQYDAYLQRLNDVIPELYGQAYDRYAQETSDLYNQYGLASQAENQDYARSMDRYNQEYARYADDLQQYRNDLNLYYDRADTEYSRLVNLITATGYRPSAEELAAAGLTQAQADAYYNAYVQSQSKGSDGSRRRDADEEEDEPTPEATPTVPKTIMVKGLGAMKATDALALVESGNAYAYTDDKGNTVVELVKAPITGAYRMVK